MWWAKISEVLNMSLGFFATYSKKKRFDALGNSQPIEMAKDSRVKRLLPPSCHRQRAECVNIQSFVIALKRSQGQSIQSYKRPFQEIKGVSHRSQIRKPLGSLRAILLSHLNRKLRDRERIISKRPVGVWLLSNGVNPHKICKGSLGSWENFIRNTASLDWKGKSEYEVKGGHGLPQILLAGSRLIKLLKTLAFLILPPLDQTYPSRLRKISLLLTTLYIE